MLFADRLYKHLFNNGALTDENSLARWNTHNNTIDPAIIGESARWGDAKREQPYTRDDWLVMRQDVETQMAGNAEKLVFLAQEAEYYPQLEPPRFSQFGGTVSTGSQLTLNARKGTIYYTLDNTDPRLPGGAVSPTAIEYQTPITLTANTLIKTRSYANGVWSALNEAQFSIDQPDRQLAITEIMYNPLGGDAYEFIELKNIGGTEIDLSNAAFEGIRYTFPPGTILLSNHVIVLIRNKAAFEQRYPNILYLDSYAKNLSNKGETITLKNPQGHILVSVTYGDDEGWPLSADGRGDSLEVIDPTGDLNNPQNWRAGKNLHGSPGVYP
jgi:hypothetical protein